MLILLIFPMENSDEDMLLFDNHQLTFDGILATVLMPEPNRPDLVYGCPYPSCGFLYRHRNSMLYHVKDKHLTTTVTEGAKTLTGSSFSSNLMPLSASNKDTD